MTWITVRLFASARELAGESTVRLPASPGLTVGTLRAALGKALPALIPLLEKSAIAVNRRYVTDAEPLAPEDEVAVIPPVAGG